MAKFKVLGFEVKDKITGLKGIITGHADYITGCDQYLVQPKGDGTKYPEASWIDEGRLDVVEEEPTITKEDDAADKNGADVPAPVK